jgi:hypothetical protein
MNECVTRSRNFMHRMYAGMYMWYLPSLSDRWAGRAERK